MAAIRQQMPTKADLEDFKLRFEQRLNKLLIQMVIIQVTWGGLILALIKLLP